jgi:putative restriction endonuclease
MPFLFKLKRPFNHIAGGGLFVGCSTLPLSLAWETFGQKNGATSLEEFRALIEPLMSIKNRDPEIGCTLLANPFFMSRFDWIESPPGGAGSIVRGKMYESGTPDGNQIWARVAHHFLQGPVVPVAHERGFEPTSSQDDPRFGEPVLVKPRIGQATFRVLVTDAYKRRCAMTGENTLVVHARFCSGTTGQRPSRLALQERLSGVVHVVRSHSENNPCLPQRKRLGAISHT